VLGTYRELADFDFSALPKFSQAESLDLARGEYLQQRHSRIFIRNPALGKTHLATGIASAACRQRRKVRFWIAANLLNELLQAQEEYRPHRLPATRPPDRYQDRTFTG
jgi:DNA replication protein DnaC